MFLTWEWLHTWWKYFHIDKTILLFLFLDGSDVIGISPLMHSIKKIYGLNIGVIEFLGTGISDYGNFIFLNKEDECVETLLNSLDKMSLKWSIIDLKNIPSSVNSLKYIQKISENKKYIVMNRAGTSHYLTLNRTWDEYLRSFSKNRRYQLRKTERNIMNKFDVTLKHVTLEDDIEECFNIFFKLYSNWLYKRQHQSTVFKISLENLKEFLYDIMCIFLKNKRLDFSILYLDNSPVSSHFNFIYNNTYYYYMSGWDLNYSQYSIGNFHMMKLLKRAMDAGFSKFDFLRGDESYKKSWRTSTMKLDRYILVKNDLKGNIIKYIDMARNHFVQ